MKVTYLNERLVSTCDVRSGNARPDEIVAVAYTHLAPALDLPRQKFKNEVPAAGIGLPGEPLSDYKSEQLARI
jgi:hypothetical protein